MSHKSIETSTLSDEEGVEKFVFKYLNRGKRGTLRKLKIHRGQECIISSSSSKEQENMDLPTDDQGIPRRITCSMKRKKLSNTIQNRTTEEAMVVNLNDEGSPQNQTISKNDISGIMFDEFEFPPYQEQKKFLYWKKVENKFVFLLLHKVVHMKN